MISELVGFAAGDVDMKWKRVTENIKSRNIAAVNYPFSKKESILRIRSETTCWFCHKKYEDCEFFGITMSDKGSKICCDDCAIEFKSGLDVEKMQAALDKRETDSWEKEVAEL